MEKARTSLRRCVCIVLGLLLFAAVLPVSVFAECAETKTVRAGWYEDAYNITGEHGERSGYGYEYEQAVAAYTGWSYEYVRNGWADLLEMMENGEIDLMGGISYTEERAQKMLFSELPMGREKYYLYADLQHTDISASDLTTLNGKRIALMPTSVQATQFYEWEESHGLHLEIVPVNSFKEGKRMAEEREIDCVVSTETPAWVEFGMSAIAVTGGTDIYFAINKDRPDLKEELDSAMRKMEQDKPFYSDTLYQRYLSAVSVPVPSSEEKAWLEQHGALKIGFLKQDPGISVLEETSGKLTGVITDYISLARDCLGDQTLEFELDGFDTLEEEIQALKDGDIDLIFHFTQNPYVAEENGFVLSNTVLAFNMAAVTTRNYFNEADENRVAIPKDQQLVKWYANYYYPSWDVVDCGSMAEAEQLVLDGQADCLLAESGQLDAYRENRALHNVFLTQPGNTSFAVNRGDTVLMSILNKTLLTIPSSMLTGALFTYDSAMRKVTLLDFIKDNLVIVAGLSLGLFAVILLLILSFLKKSQKAEAAALQAAQKAQELNRKLQESQHELQSALQAAETASRAKTDFLSSVSHDIRTPMNAIIGLTTLMENEPGLSEKMKEYLSKLESSGRHLLELINNVLDMNRIESGQTTLHITRVDLTEQLTQVENVVRPQSNAKKQYLTVSATRLTHKYVLADPTRLQQVLVNILSNAVKYTPEGGHIRFELEELPRDGHYAKLRFIVQDDGIGMTEEFQKHLFDPFTRAENSTTNKVQGTGLGMAITKSVVDLMGGVIRVESAPGKGSRFEVTLEMPIDTEARPAPGARSQPAQEEDVSPLCGMKFLCAEDNEINAEILQMLLESKGASCKIYPNGKALVDAFAKVDPGDYDMILMDVQMPVMDGLEAARLIRSGANPLGKTIPILAMTANAFLEDRQKSREAGMDEHLSKPVDITVLEQTVRRFCAVHKGSGPMDKG